MTDFKRQPMFARPTFPGYVKEGDEHLYPAMGQGDKIRGFVPEGELGTEMDQPEAEKKPAKKKA